MKGSFSNAVIHAVTIRTSKIQNQAPFAWQVFFGDDSKTTDVMVRYWRGREGASNAPLS